MSKKKWVVTTSGDSSLEDVKKDLADVGFEVEETLEAIGCITGSADDETAQKSLSVKGVAEVSPEEPEINIGPPNSPIAW